MLNVCTINNCISHFDYINSDYIPNSPMNDQRIIFVNENQLRLDLGLKSSTKHILSFCMPIYK